MPDDVRADLEVRRAAIPILRGSVVLALLTAAAFRFHLNAAATGFSYLVAVVLNGLDCGPLAAVVVSIMAVGCLDYFFIDPVFTFTVADPVDVAALTGLLTSSLVVSRLAARARQEARSARRDRRHLERLYELAQRLLSLDPFRLDQPRLLAAIRSVFDLRAVAFFDAATAELYGVGSASAGFGDRTRQAYISGQDSAEPARQTVFRRVGTAAKTLGAIGLDGLEDERLIAGPVAALAASGLERARMVRQASRAAAEAQSEGLRAAILDALAHEFKTPLATILTAAGGLSAAGPLGPEQAELAEMIETEAIRLSNLSSHLLRVARLDQEEVKPRLEPANIVEIVTAAIERYARQSPERQITFTVDGAPDEAAIDAELYHLALSQLLDNACRYSPPGSLIQVSLAGRNGCVIVVVWSGGAIPANDRARIFERFYRGREVRSLTSGTGLGLYVARKIALAHRGSLDLDPAFSNGGGVAFRLSIPVFESRFSGLVEHQNAGTSQDSNCGR